MSERDWHERIVIDPAIHHGEPVIRGTRVAVSVILANLSDLRPEELLEAYPQLTVDDIKAALMFGSERSRATAVQR